MNTPNTYEAALLEAYKLKSVSNWFGHSCATFTDLPQARRFLGALAIIRGSGLERIEPESVTTEDGREFWRVEYEPKTAEASALCSLVSLAYYGG